MWTNNAPTLRILTNQKKKRLVFKRNSLEAFFIRFLIHRIKENSMELSTVKRKYHLVANRKNGNYYLDKCVAYGHTKWIAPITWHTIKLFACWPGLNSFIENLLQALQLLFCIVHCCVLEMTNNKSKQKVEKFNSDAHHVNPILKWKQISSRPNLIWFNADSPVWISWKTAAKWELISLWCGKVDFYSKQTSFH